MLTFLWYKCLLLRLHLEPFFKTDFNHWRSDQKAIWATTNVILATNKLVSTTEKLSISHYKVILAPEEVITAT